LLNYIFARELDCMREKIILICEVCLSRNYSLYKNKENKERMQIKKYCKRCGTHTTHKESK